jgi:hypothetical protein
VVTKRNNASLSIYGDHRATTGIYIDGCLEDLSFVVHLVIYFQNFTHHPSNKDVKSFTSASCTKHEKVLTDFRVHRKEILFNISLLKFWIKIQLKGMKFHYHYKYFFPSLYQQSYGPSCSTVNLLRDNKQFQVSVKHKNIFLFLPWRHVSANCP